MADVGYVGNLYGGTQTPPTIPVTIGASDVEAGDLVYFGSGLALKVADDDDTIAGLIIEDADADATNVPMIPAQPGIIFRAAYNADGTPAVGAVEAIAVDSNVIKIGVSGSNNTVRIIGVNTTDETADFVVLDATPWA